jgi:bifunctional UDP-N-acetylglucosamine pyrophosphorylase/glucosamine-1-phosphate N-acetyltransferase
VKASSVPVHWALQDPPQGTGHAVQQAVSHLDPKSPTLVLYGDVPLISEITLQRLLDSAKVHQGMALLTARLDNPKGYGRIVRNDQDQIFEIIEEKDASAEVKTITEINTGFLVAPTAGLLNWLGQLTNQNAQGEYYLTDVVRIAASQGQTIGSVEVSDITEILGVNSQSQRAEVERYYQLRLAEHLMAQGVRLADPARIDIRGSLQCGQDIEIDIGCVFEGTVVIDAGARIGPYCLLRNTRVGAQVKIEAFSHIDDAEIGPQSTVGPYARLRPGSVLGEGAHVGNFVEMKNTQLGAHSKANHLSYLGDATIGTRVNIGAGTITCNYDGAAKHRTVIEDDAFIGSDTQLVAPVTVGQGATLGAGTTLTHDAPAHQLTVSRTPQVTVKGFKRPQKQSH